MRVLVTGGAGFIGSHVVEALQSAGHETAVIDDLSSGRRDHLPDGVPVHEVDIRDRGALAEAFAAVRPDAVCHHAAQVSVGRSLSDPALDAEINVLGTLNVIHQAHRVGITRLVFASSGGALYGETPSAADEQTPARPISPYGIGKWAGELYLAWAARELGIGGVALRYSNVYGPRQSLEGEAGVVMAFCRDLLAGTPVTIFGDGLQTRDFVHVRDVARANVLAVEAAVPGELLTVNICQGSAVTINDLACELASVVEEGLVEGLAGAGGETVHAAPRDGDIRHSLLDPGLAADLLGWSAEVNWRDGLRETVASLVAAGG